MKEIVLMVGASGIIGSRLAKSLATGCHLAGTV